MVPGTDGVDAFAINWHQENNWCVSPTHLIPKVLNHMLVCIAIGILFICTKMEIITVLANDMILQQRKFIWICERYRSSKIFFIEGSDKESAFAQSLFRCSVLVLRIDYFEWKENDREYKFIRNTWILINAVPEVSTINVPV